MLLVMRDLPDNALPLVRFIKYLWDRRLMFCFVLPFICASAVAQSPRISSTLDELSGLSLSSTAVEPYRFVAAHGRLALIEGYPAEGLEIWAYPFQILQRYHISFREAGTTSTLEDRDVLRRVIEKPNYAMRIYIGPDWMVRETLFVPLNQPAAVIQYQVESRKPLDINVHFRPELNLMWPAALGGQRTSWNSGISSFVVSEPAHGYTAVIGSPEIIAHDSTVNSTVRMSHGLGFTLRPDKSGHANVYIALNEPHTADVGKSIRDIAANSSALLEETTDHLHSFSSDILQIETPDSRVNQALAWAEVALDQAWVCNHNLGCGFVAGYGPSRDSRRPQYDWFFAGDGLIAADALVSAGDYSRARAELEFILKYQDKKNGMIWHELSQSAGFLDWASYPYMYAHSDISFQFIAAVARYVQTSGDIDFARRHWSALQAAYGYCQTLIGPSDGLPHIPPDKLGANEQDRMSDALSLSASWVAASAGFANVAELIGHEREATAATHASEFARKSASKRYWDSANQFWIQGYNGTGKPLPGQRSSPGIAIAEGIFDNRQSDAILDRIASADFQTDWGTRSVASGSASFDPNSYSKGSVSALGSAGVANVYWSAHRPLTAISIWNALVPWVAFDSLGHMHELMAGDYYHAQIESVPEQTWSSAGLLEAFARGLLGLQVEGSANQITFAPHLPPNWSQVSVQNIRLPNSLISLNIRQTFNEVILDLRNSGSTFQMNFMPEIPLGAKVAQATLDGKSFSVKEVSFPEEDQAVVQATMNEGAHEVRIRYKGGVSIFPQILHPQAGDSSMGIKLIRVAMAQKQLTIVADVASQGASQLRLRIDENVIGVHGATLERESNNIYILKVSEEMRPQPQSGYKRVSIRIDLKP